MASRTNAPYLRPRQQFSSSTPVRPLDGGIGRAAPLVEPEETTEDRVSEQTLRAVRPIPSNNEWLAARMFRPFVRGPSLLVSRMERGKCERCGRAASVEPEETTAAMFLTRPMGPRRADLHGPFVRFQS